MGEKGSILFSLKEDGSLDQSHVEAVKFSDHPDLKLVDVTAAGDCFMGALAS
jgi:sugar/nucleoside kinase (ribokinase family)